MNLMMQYQTGPSYADNAEGMVCARAAARLACAVDGCPTGLWVRDGWLAVSTVAPDMADDDTRTDLAMYAALWASYHAPVSLSGSERVCDDRQRVGREGDADRRSDQPCRRAERGEQDQLSDVGGHERQPITYDERRSHLTPCKCGALFTHPHLCDANEKCMAAQHPHHRPLTLAEQRSRTP